MDWRPLAETIEKIGAPILAGALLRPSGDTIGAALATKFGANPTDQEDIIQKINADLHAHERIIELEKIYLQQTKSYLTKICTEYETTKILALGFTIGFFVWLLTIVFFPGLKNDTITMGLISGETIILTYYFGSSKDKK